LKFVDHIFQVLGIELLGARRRIGQIAKHDREVPALRFLLGRRRRRRCRRIIRGDGQVRSAQRCPTLAAKFIAVRIRGAALGTALGQLRPALTAIFIFRRILGLAVRTFHRRTVKFICL
jgi:hypothetical protein